MALKDSVALVTGGAMGIGFHAMKAFLKRGAKGVIFTDVNIEAGKNAEYALCKEFGPGKVKYLAADSSHERSSKKVFKRAVNEYGHLDVVFNNAGIINEEVWTKTIDINFRGAIYNTNLAFQFLNRYKSKKHGTLLNNCSIVALNAFPSIPVYSGSKHGLIAFSRAFFDEEVVKCAMTKVMCLCPGVTQTNILAQGGEAFLTAAKAVKDQPVEVCGEHAAQIIENDKHGSIWVSEGSELYEVKLPNKGENRTPFRPPEDKTKKRKPCQKLCP